MWNHSNNIIYLIFPGRFNNLSWFLEIFKIIDP